MRPTRYLLAALAALALTGGSARANTCVAGKLTCTTTMPVEGYCECTAHGMTEGGEVVAKPMSHKPANATAGGCGANPMAPGCH
jgi:hypothetical protein